MSSSMFIESSSLPASNNYTSTSDSNLVVVYGKNGINFDDKGLENLIDEKKISSISVIRLTSPTPSMEDEEVEEAKLEEMIRRQELDSANESSGVDEVSTLSDDDRYDTVDNIDSSDGDDNADQHSTQGSDDNLFEEKRSKNKIIPRRRGRQTNAAKQKKLRRKRMKERPEIVGLRFEEFYPPDDANEIIKEALKMAGLGPDRKSKADYEFQLLVIKNDHCYTPFTSPSQMKAKLAADKIELEKQTNNRKITTLQTSTGKQLFSRKKSLQRTEIQTKCASPSSVIKDKTNISLVSTPKKDCKGVKSQPEDDGVEDDPIRTSMDENDDAKAGGADEESEGTASEVSDESDNDRDSDLDFVVNNPKGRRRKIKTAKIVKRPVGTPKIQQKPRRLHTQEELSELSNKTSSSTATSTAINRQKAVLKNMPDAGRITVRSTPTKILHAGGCVPVGGSVGQTSALSPMIAALPPIPKKQNENKLLATPTGTNVVNKSVVLKSTSVNQTLSPQTHKEILIHRQIMSSPKTRGFTDLNTLMDQHDKKKTITPVARVSSPKPSTSTTTITSPKTTTTSLKVFMPLGMETAAKNQLPAQISIQTHQSSSELEAEHDKQLDLINSIVQDEMEKSNEILMPASNIENIPELVKMLESTESTLVPKITFKKSEYNVDKTKDSSNCDNANIGDVVTPGNNNTTIADIDISHASLLATTDAEDDLPDDILQQVVDLIKDDKTLQEAVDVLGAGGDCSEPITSTSNPTTQNPPPLAPISQQANNKTILEDIPHSSKSIIQMSISNIPLTNASPRITIIPNRVISSNQAMKMSSPLIRKEPIQIVRGNGRVITLPPIEAPTTRAKRRAQAQPSTLASAVNSSPSSSVTVTNVNEASLDSSMHSSSSIISVGGPINIAQEKKIHENVNRRRGSKESIITTGTIANQKTKRTTVNKKTNRPQIDVDESGSGDEDDDDPNKLWCICRQPHNNRFMICCDACEDWFHGTCVNITKAMGLEMEQKGIDWTCPKCLRKHEEQKQPKITDLLIKKPVATVIQVAEAPPSTRIMPKETCSVATTAITGNLQQEVTKIQPKEVNQNSTESQKPKIPSGQFINFKDLSGKKVIIQAATSGSSAGQKKLFVTTAQPIRATLNHGTSIRTFTVVKQISCQGKQSQHQNIKVIKTISPAQSTTQNVTVTNISNTVTPNEPSTSCIVCKKIARPNSIYCNDECIRKHSQTAWHDFISKSQTEIASPGSPLNKSAPDDKAKKKSKGLFEEVLSLADRKTKMERAIVLERKSGRILSGNSAPTFSNLKKWLLDNPTFEAIQPGSAPVMDIEKKQKLRGQHSSSPTVLKMTTSPPPLQFLPLSSTVQQKSEIRSNSPQAQSSIYHKPGSTAQTKPNRNIPDLIKSSELIKTTNARPGTPKQLQKYPQQVVIKADKIQKSYDDVKSPKEKLPPTKRPVNTEVCNKSSDGDIRLVVRRTLNEQLLLRIQDEGVTSGLNASMTDNTKLTDTPKLTPDEIEEFAKATELEMYNYFNRDTGAKYKAKYRSLVFNIKDRKNHTLYAKICGKLIEPKQLVRMSPEEMASQELAQWREQETKHQLEMIKKSELDLLACAKNYVLKTHKGEEVIEGKSSDYENVDLTIPVEDVVSTLNKSGLSEEATMAKSQTHWSDVEYTSMSHGNMADSILQIDEEKINSSNNHNKEKDKERENVKHREREREKRHKSKDRHRDKSRTRKRSRSHSRSRSRERNDKRHKSSHKEEKRDREKDRIKDRSERDQPVDSTDKKSLIERRTITTSKTRESFAMKRQTHDQHSIPLETYNLVDKILESTKTVEEAANLVSDRNKDIDHVRKPSVITTVPTQTITSTTISSCDTSSVVDIPAPSSYVESDQEPTSTVSIPTPPHDPYARFISLDSPSLEGSGSKRNVSTLWSGNINMVDVTSFHLCLQHVLGNCTGLSKLLAKELDVVGRIGPETVWDYISKIKKSPNKEIVIIRLLPASETETAAYKLLYEYLDNRSRLGVIKSVSPFIKDFYIYPLGSGKLMPIVLRPSESVEFYDDPCRPDVLIGIIIRVVGKRHNTLAQQSMGVADTTVLSNKFVKNEADSITPPGSPKTKKRRQSIVPKDIDVDAIIKAPIVSKSHKALSTTASVSLLKDADEPYSPGGSSDDDLPLLPIKLSTIGSHQMQTAEEELKRKMEEINRQIAAQEMEIAGLLTGESTKFTASATTSNVLANIAIPSNLSQILASIKPTISTQEGQPAVPPPPPLIGSLIKTPSTLTAADEEYNPAEPIDSSYELQSATSSSRLAKLSEAELLSMVPDDVVITSKTPAVRYEEPPPPGV